MADVDLERDRVGTAPGLGSRPWVLSGMRVWPAWAMPVALYAVAAALLTVRIGGHPSFAYNWESYSAWQTFHFWDHPSMRIFALTDGLMTNSGNSPLVSFPIWLGWKLAGVGLVAMRLPLALIAALAVPLLWLVGRRLTDTRMATLAALLLALSPVFLLYGRTATLVGVSLVPALVTIAVLIRLIAEPHQQTWLVVLQALLIFNGYAYAPIRFLWLLSLALLTIEFVSRPAERRRLAFALVVTALVLPAALIAIDDNPLDAVVGYYNGRGEQIFSLSDHPEEFAYYLQLSPEEEEAGAVAGSTWVLARRLILQNAEDLARMLLDWDRRPVLTDYWSFDGRLYAAPLVPFFFLGQLRILRGARRYHERTLLVLFWGFVLPLLLTTRVDVGRLFFALPLLFLIVAIGIDWVLDGVGKAVAAAPRRSLLRLAITFGLVALVARSTWADYRVDLPPSIEARTASMLANGLPDALRDGGVVLIFGDASYVEIESINVAALRLALDDDYRFVDLTQPRFDGIDDVDPKPPIFYGGLLDLLASPAAIPHFCDNAYYVAPVALERFRAALKPIPPECEGPLRYRVLPG